MNELKARHVDLFLESPLDVPRFLPGGYRVIGPRQNAMKTLRHSVRNLERALGARTSEKIHNDKCERTPISALMNERNETASDRRSGETTQRRTLPRWAEHRRTLPRSDRGSPNSQPYGDESNTRELFDYGGMCVLNQQKTFQQHCNNVTTLLKYSKMFLAYWS